MMDVAATSSPSPATTAPRFKTSYSTERPRTSAASANPIGFSAPSTSHTNRALYSAHADVGVNTIRTVFVPPGGISSAGQSTSYSIAPSASSDGPSHMISLLHRNTAGSIVMFCIVTSRSTCTPR
jgi:hypothetical protein